MLRSATVRGWVLPSRSGASAVWALCDQVFYSSSRKGSFVQCETAVGTGAKGIINHEEEPHSHQDAVRSDETIGFG